MRTWKVLLESRMTRKCQVRFGEGYAEKGSNVPRYMPTLHEFDERHRIVDAPVDRGAAAPESNGSEPRAIANSRPTASTNGRARTASNGNGNTYQQAAEENDPQGPMTEQQRASINKLCQHLGKAEPQPTDSMNYLAAKELIAQLSQEYRQSRSKAS